AEGQFRVQTADDVQLRCAFLDCFAGNPKRLVNVVCISICLTRSTVETAKLTVGIADIRRIEMTVDVEISYFAVLVAAYFVCQFSESWKIIGRIELKPV